MDIQTAIAVLTLLGVGAIIPKILEHYSNRQKTKEQTKHDYKQVRYKALILLMYSSLDFEKHKQSLLKYNRSFQIKADLHDELVTEWINMALYASDNVILAMKVFLQNPNMDTFIDVTFAMRKDLYNIKTKLEINDLKLD